MQRTFTIAFDVQTLGQYKAEMQALLGVMQQMVPVSQQLHQNFQGVGSAAVAGRRSTRDWTDELGAFITKGMLIAETKKLVGEVGEIFKQNREYAHDVAEEAAKLYERLREIANLRHQDTGKTATQFLDTMTRTPATQGELATLSGEFEGAIDAARASFTASRGKVGIDPKNTKLAQDIQEQTATFAVRTGLDMSTAGRLMGVLGQYTKFGSTEQAMTTFGSMMNHLNVEGVAPMAQMGKPLMGLLADFAGEGGRVSDPRDLAATYAVGTRAFRSPSTAATGMRQANRLLRKAAINQDHDPELAAMGITSDDDFLSGLRKMSSRLGAPDADLFLQKHGIGKNSTERDSVIKYGHLLGQIDVALTDPDAAAEATRTMQRNREFMTTDPAGKRRMAENTREVARLRRGVAETPYDTAMIEAEGRLTERGEIDTDASRSMGFLMDVGDWGAKQMGFAPYRQRQIMREAERSLKARAAAAGVDADAAAPGMRGDVPSPLAFNPLALLMGVGPALVSGMGGMMGQGDRRAQFGRLEKDTQAAEMQLEAAKMNLEAAKARQAAGGGAAGLPGPVGGVGVAPRRM
jgi:hypothetical protein